MYVDEQRVDTLIDYQLDVSCFAHAQVSLAAREQAGAKGPRPCVQVPRLTLPPIPSITLLHALPILHPLLPKPLPSLPSPAVGLRLRRSPARPAPGRLSQK